MYLGALLSYALRRITTRSAQGMEPTSDASQRATSRVHAEYGVYRPGQAEPVPFNPAAPYGATAVAGAHRDQQQTSEEDAAS
jgi:hypothetical protein